MYYFVYRNDCVVITIIVEKFMNITNLTLCDFIRLRVSRIKEISIDTSNSDTQLLIGSNGSGKSSIMHEFFPYPPVKSSFGKTGFKSLSLQHSGHNYIITYDPSYGHQFMKDDTNLNISGTYDIQKELIYEHFGITNDIHTILKCSLPICDMVPSQRKKILMNMNPIDISFFLEKYQKVHKDVIAYSNNLDRLYARQKQLEIQRLPEEQYKQMLERRSILENQEKTLLIWMTKVSSELVNFPEVEGISGLDAVMSSTLRALAKEILKYNDIPRDTYKSVLVEYKTRTEILMTDLLDIEKNIEETIITLNDYETKKALINIDGTNVEQELSLLTIHLNSFIFDKDFNAATEEQLPELVKTIDTIKNILVNLSYLEYSTIHDRDTINVMYKKLLDDKASIESLKREMQQLSKRKVELIENIKTYQTGDNCDTNKCELLSIYTKHNTTKQTELSKIDESLTHLQSDHDRRLRDYDQLAIDYSLQLRIWEIIEKVTVAIQRYPSLNYKFTSIYISDRIRQSPIIIIDDLQQYLQQNESYIEYTKLSKKARELEKINASLESKKLLSVEILDKEINSYSERLIILRKRYHEKQELVNILTAKQKHLNDYSEVKDRVKNLADTVELIEKNVIQKSSREYLLRLYNVMNTTLNNIRSELVDITTISKEQEMLIVRLDTEINSIIDELKPKYEQAKHIEKSLYELPIEYTRSFINNIIETTNYFINEIMTYPMYLLPIADGENCDFNFPVLIENEVRTKDISTCSTGQQAVIQLAFNLAIIVELRFNQYPIYSDEANRALDATHSKRLTEFLLKLVSSGIVSQLFVVNHDETMIEQLSHTGNIIVLNGDNLVLPERYNSNVSIVTY